LDCDFRHYPHGLELLTKFALLRGEC